MMGLSQGAYARHRGCSRPAVKKAIDTGRLKKAILPDGTIDAAIADREWAENTNPEKQANGWKKAKGAAEQPQAPLPPAPAPRQPAKKSPAPARPAAVTAPAALPPAGKQSEAQSIPETGIDFNKARTAREIFAAKTAELDFRERAKELVKRDDVQVGIFKVLTILRTHVMGIHSKCRLQADLPPHIVMLIENLCRGGLEDAATSLQELADGKL